MSGRMLAATFAATLLLGAAGSAWISWHYGWLKVDTTLLPGSLLPDSPSTAPQAASPAPPLALPPESVARIAALEARLTELDREAKAASGNASRAEGLLIAFAARRAIERGEPLGYLEHQLHLRFGESLPRSVDRIVRASTRPVTLNLLNEQLEVIAPQLSAAAPQEKTWDRMRREVSELFIIRHAESPSPDPQQRLMRARQYLAGGRVQAAADEVARMPGRDAARGWLAMAQDYLLTERALNLIENAALLQPQAQVQVQAQVQAAPAPTLPTSAPIAPF